MRSAPWVATLRTRHRARRGWRAGQLWTDLASLLVGLYAPCRPAFPGTPPMRRRGGQERDGGLPGRWRHATGPGQTMRAVVSDPAAHRACGAPRAAHTRAGQRAPEPQRQGAGRVVTVEPVSRRHDPHRHAASGVHAAPGRAGAAARSGTRVFARLRSLNGEQDDGFAAAPADLLGWQSRDGVKASR